LAVSSEERSRPTDAIAPPTKVVVWMPNLSVNIPATGERKNVVPIVNEPTKAETILPNYLMNNKMLTESRTIFFVKKRRHSSFISFNFKIMSLFAVLFLT